MKVLMCGFLLYMPIFMHVFMHVRFRHTITNKKDKSILNFGESEVKLN